MKSSPHHARARSRRYAMQALYQWDLSGLDLNEIETQFLVEEDFTRADKAYFNELLHGVPRVLDSIDAQLVRDIDRPLEQIDPVERAVLRIAIYELLYRQEIPFRVIINEAVTLSRKFGAEQGHGFVNAVLDRTAQHLRPDEYPKEKDRASRA